MDRRRGRRLNRRWRRRWSRSCWGDLCSAGAGAGAAVALRRRRLGGFGGRTRRLRGLGPEGTILGFGAGCRIHWRAAERGLSTTWWNWIKFRSDPGFRFRYVGGEVAQRG